MAKLNNFSVAIYMGWRLLNNNAESIYKLLNKGTCKLQFENDKFHWMRPFSYSNPTVLSTKINKNNSGINAQK